MNLSRILTCTALLVSLFSFAQKYKPIYKNVADHWAHVPTSVLVNHQNNLDKQTSADSVAIKEFWMSKTESTNFEYLEFVSSIKKSGNTELLKQVLPDTTVWTQKNNHNEPYVKYYFRHPAYRDYPVVGITHTQALLYCQWLTDIYNSKLKELFPKLNAKKVEVRLPSVDEWKLAAKGGLELSPYPWGGPYVRNSQGDYLANFYKIGEGTIRYNATTEKPEISEIPSYEEYMGVAGRLNDNADITAPVKSYWPNGYGLYNMAGNVAEMTSNPGTAKGGSWRTCGYDLQIEAPDPFEGNVNPKAFVGFRPVIVIVE